MIKFTGKATLLSAESKPYEFEGKSGVSHRIRLAVDGEIYPCKSSESQIVEMRGYVSMEGQATIEVVSRKEVVSLRLDSFKPTK